MKKYITIIALLILIATPLSSVWAHSIMSFDKATINASVGQTFSVVVSVDPDEAKNYTVKLVLDYPADMLSVTGFSFANSWTQLNQSGYDSIDNASGRLIKTAGYPGGFATKKVFGTATFKVLKSGNATVAVNSSAMVLDANNQNMLTAHPVFTVAVASPAPAPTPTTIPTPKPTATPTNNTPAVVQTEPEVEQIIEEPIVAQDTTSTAEKTLLASLTDSVSSNKITTAIIVLLVFVVVAFIIIVLTKKGGLKKIKRKNKK